MFCSVRVYPNRVAWNLEKAANSLKSFRVGRTFDCSSLTFSKRLEVVVFPCSRRCSLVTKRSSQVFIKLQRLYDQGAPCCIAVASDHAERDPHFVWADLKTGSEHPNYCRSWLPSQIHGSDVGTGIVRLLHIQVEALRLEDSNIEVFSARVVSDPCIEGEDPEMTDAHVVAASGHLAERAIGWLRPHPGSFSLIGAAKRRRR